MQYDQYWVSSHYLGAGLMALAVAGSWGARNRRVWLLLAVAVLSVIMALGSRGYLYSGVKAVLPQLGFIRYPIKFVVLAVLVIPILAAYGVSWHQAAAANSTRERKVIQSVTLLLLGLMGLIVWVAWEYPMVKDDWGATWHGTLERAGFLVLAAGTLLLLKRAAEFKLQILLRLGLLLLLWLDVYTHTPTLSPTVKRSVYESGLIRQELKLDPRASQPRFMETLAAMDKVRATSLNSPQADYLCHRLALFDDCNLLDDVPKIDGFYSLYLRDTQQIIAMLSMEDKPDTDLKGLKDFLGVAYINPAGAAAEKALDWVARDTYLPLVTAGQAPVFAADADELPALARTDFDPRQTVYLPPEAKASITARRAEAKILSQQIEAQRLKVEVAADASAMVVVAQAFYHPWRAYVDGARVKLWRANHGFQALEVPAGRHEVRLVYEDRVFEGGAVISLATLGALALVLFRRRAGSAKAEG